VGSFGASFLRFLLAYLDELEMPLEFESDEDADSILGFELMCETGIAHVCEARNVLLWYLQQE
jgi:lysyl-tRNA synthetase class I